MAELWQAYGTWVLYGLFFLVFLWLHGFMHGRGGHGGHGTTRGGVGHGGSHDSHAMRGDPPGARPAGGSLEDNRADAGAHAGHTSGSEKKTHKHGGGCC